MSLRLESRLQPVLLWPNWVWTFLLSEVFLVIWMGVYYMPPDVLIEAHFWNREILFGLPGEHGGIVLPMVVVNAVVVVGLGFSVWSARHEPRRFFLPTAVTALAAAVVLAAISWSGVAVRKLYPPIKVERVLELDDEGNYRVREAGGR